MYSKATLANIGVMITVVQTTVSMGGSQPKVIADSFN
jgi:hypothetical protein